MEVPEQDFRKIIGMNEELHSNLVVARKLRELDLLIIMTLVARTGGDVTITKEEIQHTQTTYQMDEQVEITQLTDDTDGKIRFKLRVK